MGHQAAVPVNAAVLATTLADFLSNGMAVYETGMVGNALEKIVTEHFASKFGLNQNSAGLITSGGTV